MGGGGVEKNPKISNFDLRIFNPMGVLIFQKCSICFQIQAGSGLIWEFFPNFLYFTFYASPYLIHFKLVYDYPGGKDGWVGGWGGGGNYRIKG